MLLRLGVYVHVCDGELQQVEKPETWFDMFILEAERATSLHCFTHSTALPMCIISGQNVSEKYYDHTLVSPLEKDMHDTYFMQQNNSKIRLILH